MMGFLIAFFTDLDTMDQDFDDVSTDNASDDKKISPLSSPINAVYSSESSVTAADASPSSPTSSLHLKTKVNGDVKTVEVHDVSEEQGQQAKSPQQLQYVPPEGDRPEGVVNGPSTTKS